MPVPIAQKLLGVGIVAGLRRLALEPHVRTRRSTPAWAAGRNWGRRRRKPASSDTSSTFGGSAVMSMTSRSTPDIRLDCSATAWRPEGDSTGTAATAGRAPVALRDQVGQAVLVEADLHDVVALRRPPGGEPVGAEAVGLAGVLVGAVGDLEHAVAVQPEPQDRPVARAHGRRRLASTLASSGSPGFAPRTACSKARSRPSSSSPTAGPSRRRRALSGHAPATPPAERHRKDRDGERKVRSSLAFRLSAPPPSCRRRRSRRPAARRAWRRLP